MKLKRGAWKYILLAIVLGGMSGLVALLLKTPSILVSMLTSGVTAFVIGFTASRWLDQS